MNCPVCASADLVQATRDLPYIFKGQSTVLPAIRGAFCPACREGVVEGAESTRLIAARMAFHHAVDAASCLVKTQ